MTARDLLKKMTSDYVVLSYVKGCKEIYLEHKYNGGLLTADDCLFMFNKELLDSEVLQVGVCYVKSYNSKIEKPAVLIRTSYDYKGD